MKTRRSRQRGALYLAATLAGAVIGATSFWLASPDPAADAGQKPETHETVPIEWGTLSGSTQVQGTLDYAGQRKLAAGVGGTLTSLPVPGALIGIGQDLYSVDNRPVVLMHGPLPAWRGFADGMAAGPDVKQLETNLAALGFFTRAPDEIFGTATQDAIKRWQKAAGMTITGTIDHGMLVFSPGDVRVGAVGAALGDQVGPGTPILTLSSLDKQVDVDLKLADQRLGVVGSRVLIDLPGGVSAEGTITTVGVPIEKEVAGKTVVGIPITVILDDPSVAGEVHRASVTVAVPSDTRENVLSVPVEALLALSGGGFGVELVNGDGSTSRVPVETGLFAAGRVEIFGDGIAKDQKVVVPTL